MGYEVWLERETWKALWVALRRARRDKHARVVLLRLCFSLVVLVPGFGYCVYQIRGNPSDFGLTLGIVLLVVATVTVVALSISALFSKLGALYRRIERRVHERHSPAVPQELKRTIFRETCLLATLLERLGSEAALEKEIPPEIVVITRRVLLDRLSKIGLREGLEPWLLDLLLAPDGHWSLDQKRRAFPAWECLAVLRWALGLDALRGLTEDPKYNLADVRSLFAILRPEKLIVLPGWDVRPARDTAGMFFHRCWAELLARRSVDGAAQEDVERALKIRADIEEEGYTCDYLVGSRTIAELESPMLWSIATRAYNRWQLLSLLVEFNGGELPPETLRQFLARYFAPAEPGQSPPESAPA